MSLRLPLGRIEADFFQSPHAVVELDPLPALVAAFTGARSSITFGIYSFTNPVIASALLGAKARGVTVVGVADRTEARQPTSQIPALVAAGIDVLGWGGPYRLMHDKVFVVDDGIRCVVGLGSYNWTTQAEKSNVEVLLLARGIQVSRALAPALRQQIDAARRSGLPF